MYVVTAIGIGTSTLARWIMRINSSEYIFLSKKQEGKERAKMRERIKYYDDLNRFVICLYTKHLGMPFRSWHFPFFLSIVFRVFLRKRKLYIWVLASLII